MPSNTPEYAKEYQSKNREQYNKLQRLRRNDYGESNKALVRAYKDTPCLDCGNKFPPECMDFDHVRGKKHMGISCMIYNHSTKSIIAEIEKCEVVCSNCHRIRTEARRNKSK